MMREIIISQKISIFLHLLNGGRINLKNARSSKFYWCHKLPDRIHEMRQICGISNVIEGRVEASRYPEYFIDPEFLKTARARKIKAVLSGERLSVTN